MLRPLLVGLTLLAIPGLPTGAADKPIPQDRERMERRSRDWLAWNRRTLVEEYDRVGRKDGRWDAAAREALELGARRFSLQEPLVQPEEIFQAAGRAVDAGCDDPLVLYLYARTSVKPSNYPGPEEFIKRTQRSCDAMKQSPCSPARRAYAQLRAIASMIPAGAINGEAKRRVEGELDAIVALIGPSTTADPRGEFWERHWFECLEQAYGDYKRINGRQSQAAFDRIDAQLAKIPAVASLRLALKGNFLVSYAWEARGSSVAATVAEKQFATFEQRLQEAKTALEAAYKLNPNQPNVARRRIAVALGLGEDRETMETWFDRAMALDGNDQAACEAKFFWLSPRWHGDPEGRDALAFGRACAATKNWRNGLSLLGPESIYYRAMEISKEEQESYMTRPETWATIQAAYDDYLTRYPHDALALSKYAYFAYLCRQFEAADRLFRRVGEDLAQWGGMNWCPLEKLKIIRGLCEQRVAERAGKPKQEATKGTGGTEKGKE